QADGARGGLGCASDHLEQRALARTVDPDDADRLSGGNMEADVPENPRQGMSRLLAGNNPFGEPAQSAAVLPVGLAQLADRYLAHQSSSTISPDRFLKSRIPQAHNTAASSVIGHNDAQSGHCPWTRIVW